MRRLGFQNIYDIDRHGVFFEKFWDYIGNGHMA